MAYGMQDLRPRNFFDQMTPSYGGGGGQDPLFFEQPPPGGGYDSTTGILGPDGQPLPTQQAPITPPQVGADNSTTETQQLIDAINKVYTPEYASRDRFNRLLDNFPGEYTPTRGDRWTAAFMGLGAGGRQGGDSIKTMDYVLQGPRMRDIEEWKLKSDPYGKAAQYENTANANERALAGNVVTGIYNQNKNRIMQEKNQMNYEVSTIRNEVARLRAQGANVRVSFDGPTVLIYENGVVRDTGVPTGNMSEMAKISLQNAGRVEAYKQIGANQQANTTLREGQYTVDANGRLYRIEGTKKTPVDTVEGEQGPPKPFGGGGGGPQGQLEENRIENNRIEAWLRANPSKYDYVTEEETNTTGKTSLIGQNPVSNNYDLGSVPQPPEGGKGYLESESAHAAKWQEYKERMARYNELRAKLFNLPPLPVAGTRAGGYTGANDPNRGATTTATTTIPPTGPSSGPPSTSGMTDVKPAGNVGPTYKLKRNPQNPNQMARTLDGKTWQTSNDGGKTWR